MMGRLTPTRIVLLFLSFASMCINLTLIDKAGVSWSSFLPTLCICIFIGMAVTAWVGE